MTRHLRIALALTRVYFAVLAEYRATIFIWMLAGAMPLLMMIVWRHVAEDGAIGGIDRDGFARYFLVTFVVYAMTRAWVIWNFDYHIRQGTLAINLVRPLDPYLPEVIDNLSANLFRLPMVLVVFVPCLWITGTLVSLPWSALPAFTLAVALSWAVTFNLSYLIAMFAFWTERARSLDAWADMLIAIFGGGMFPLALLPGWVQSALVATPFPYIIDFPVRVLAEGVPAGELLRGYAMQVVWIVLIVIVHRLLWREGLKRFAAVGG